MSENKLNVLWTNADELTSEHMVMLYTINAKKMRWFEEISIIIWGATAKLVAENKRIQELVQEAIASGVEVKGCIHCAKQLNVEKKLVELGVDLEAMGIPLTNILKEDGKLLTI